MPELPEVEVTRRQIAPLLLDRPIARVRTTRPSYFFLTSPARLRARLTGRVVRALDRHGKYLVATLDDAARLLLHLGMTGQLFAAGSASVRLLRATGRAALSPEAQLAGFVPDQHTHLTLFFADEGPAVCFRDARKFGKVQWLAAAEPCDRLDKLGVDALAASGRDLYDATRGRRTALKNVLLDQSVLAGVGNIYADEALFLAGLRPTRGAAGVSARSADAVVAALQRVMRRSIETGGSSIRDYVHPDGSDGGYQDERWVYARAGAPCRRCGAVIRRVVVGQRGTHYCPRCQK